MEEIFMEIEKLPKKTLLILGILLAVLAIASFFELYNETEMVAQEEEQVVESVGEAEMETEHEAEQLVVYVSGAVQRPGVIRLSEGARIYEAVDLCGGVLPTADSAKVNLAQPLKDGMQIHIPEKAGFIVEEQAPQRSTEEKSDLININTADAEGLMKINGVGKATAAAILEYREREGGFQTLEDLKRVNGIGEKKFARISSQVTL